MSRRFPAAVVVAAYALAFGAVLPAGLWRVAGTIDRAGGWAAAPSPWGWLPLGAGLGLLAAGIAQLWVEVRALPVSALPPPRLARGGPYRFVRHPIYLGFNVALLGAGLAAGSPALAWVVAPAFAPAWVAYALLEERGLSRRFGRRYRRYRRRVGLLPGPPVWSVTRLAALAWPVRVTGREHVPPRGAAVLVANHCCYLDPAFLARLTLRKIHVAATAEVGRRPLLAWYTSRLGAVPLRRYRPDPAAWREMLRLLEEGELVAFFPEGERSTSGAYQGAIPAAAAALRRLQVPVVPVAIDGSYDCGPRWADVVRCRPVALNAGPPLRWDGADPAAVIDAALRGLLAHDPQPLRWDGLPLRRLGRVLWRCPHCLDGPGWRAGELCCSRCGARWAPLPDGRLRSGDGAVSTLAALARRVAAAGEVLPLVAEARASLEPPRRRSLGKLVPLGGGLLSLDQDGLQLGSLRVALADVRSVTVERSDTLQVASSDRMWQFELREGSAFRFERALARALGEGRRAA